MLIGCPCPSTTTDWENRIQLLSRKQEMELPATSRAWRKADLFTILVELHRVLMKQQLHLDPKQVAQELSTFYGQVDTFREGTTVAEGMAKYSKASLQATNDRSSRITRGQNVAEILKPTALATPNT
jgi:hypothetical protein